MDAVPKDRRECLGDLWRILMAWLGTAASKLQTLELLVSDEYSLIPYDVQRVLEAERPKIDRRGDFLHDGRPESVANQVYDWSLLRALVACGKVETVVFTLERQRHRKCVWYKYPNTVRVIKNSLPKLKVKFRTK